MMRILSILAILIVNLSVTFAQPSSNVVYPIALNKGGTAISNETTIVSTSGNITAQAIATGNLYFNSSSAVTIQGIAAPSPAKDIRIWIYNRSSGVFFLAQESGSATAANRIFCPSGTNLKIPILSGVSLVYISAISRWVVSDQPFDVVSATAPVVYSSGVVSMPAATSAVDGYLSATNFTTYMDNWKQTGNDIYQTNTNNVWITLYPCSDWNASYSSCVSNACTPVNGGSCSTATGTDEGTCTALGGANQCSWSDPDCSGSYFTSCSGDGYRKDDGTQSKLQVKATSQCAGTATACAGLAETPCNAQDGCGPFVASTCAGQGDQSSCEGASCSWGGAYCSGDNSVANTCPSYTDSTTCDAATPCYSNMGGDCTTASNTDEATCLALNAGGGDCAWADPDCTGTGYFLSCDGDNSVPNSCPSQMDEGSCGSAGCTWVPDSCSGDNSSCPGTATVCSSFDSSGTCAAQAGCSYTLTPALRAQGDNITTSDGYLQFLKTSAGAPTSGDCDNDSEYGRMAIDTTNERLYICNGASRGWDYTALTN